MPDEVSSVAVETGSPPITAGRTARSTPAMPDRTGTGPTPGVDPAASGNATVPAVSNNQALHTWLEERDRKEVPMSEYLAAINSPGESTHKNSDSTTCREPSC